MRIYKKQGLCSVMAPKFLTPEDPNRKQNRQEGGRQESFLHNKGVTSPCGEGRFNPSSGTTNQNNHKWKTRNIKIQSGFFAFICQFHYQLAGNSKIPPSSQMVFRRGLQLTDAAVTCL